MNSFLRSRIAKWTGFASMLAASTALMVTPATASVMGARITAARLFDALSDDWFVRDHFTSGLLNVGQSVYIRTTLHAGRNYKIVAGGCEDAFDVDIAVYDENGNFIDGDDDTTALAVADVAPRWTGTFIVKVTMYSVRPRSGNAAHYVVQYAYL
jgi:hypothetical protein